MSKTLDEHAQELMTQGFTIVPGVLDLAEIEKARELLGRVWDDEKAVGPERGWHNESWIISYCLPAKHEFFRSLALNPRVLPLMQKILGSDCILSSLNGMKMVPNGQGQKLHIDQPQHTPGLIVNINATYALDDFTKANGATRLIPKTQDREPGTPIDAQRDEAQTIYLEAPAGSLLAFNGGIVHAGSANTTSGPRRCIHTFYSRPWVRSQWDFAHSFSPDVKAALNEEEKTIFGFYAHEQVFDLKTRQVTRW